MALLLPAAAAIASDFLPLETGNQWTYRNLASGQSFTVRVGTPLATQDGAVYHRLSGYVTRPLWVRALADGSLVWLDEETGEEQTLTSFEAAGGGWSEAPFRECDQENRVAGTPAPHLGAAGWFARAQRLEYRSFGCADAGVESEVFAAGVGMVQRTVTTIAGPRVYELVSARVGRLVLEAAPATMFSATLAEKDGGGLSASLRLVLGTGEPADLVFHDAQEYDFAIWDEHGKAVYRWSDGKAFAQALQVKTVSGELRYEAPVEMAQPLPDGRYVLEAWLTTGPERRGYASMAPFRIEGGRLVR
ncbi:MAG: BsuPI-related putative proteinase inhibitor [Bryobacteraceae bacterium]